MSNTREWTKAEWDERAKEVRDIMARQGWYERSVHEASDLLKIAAECLGALGYFTREHLRALRSASALAATYADRSDDFVIQERSSQHVPGKIGSYAVLTLGDLRAMSGLADLIAALLPPESVG
jgi:hypothetical protein